MNSLQRHSEFPSDKEQEEFADRTWKYAPNKSPWLYEHFQSKKIREIAKKYAMRIQSSPFEKKEDAEKLFNDNQFTCSINVKDIRIGYESSPYLQIVAHKKRQ